MEIIKDVFVETAYTTAEVERAIESEEKHGLRKYRCAFIGDLNANDMIDKISEASLHPLPSSAC